jgi:tRNA (adenine22-N1)-methyltransferase
MKLSNRLTALCQSIDSNAFPHIWDCCCDHGYLGRQLMLDHPESHIHFVDVVPHLIDQVTVDLNNQPLNNWAVHCLDAAAIQLDPSQNHLVLIAGVGGDLLIEMVNSIVSHHSELMLNRKLDFILCPVRQLHKVRTGLNALKLGLVSEQIVEENNLFYEVIHVSNQSDKAVSLVGEAMWDLSNPAHVSYQQTMIRHFEKQPNDVAKQLLALYQGIL